MLAGNAILYSNGPILSITSNGLQYRATNLAQLSIFSEILLDFTRR